MMKVVFISFQTSGKLKFLCNPGLFTPKLNFNVISDLFFANFMAEGPWKAKVQ